MSINLVDYYVFEDFGVKVYYVVTIISDLIKDGYMPMVFQVKVECSGVFFLNCGTEYAPGVTGVSPTYWRDTSFSNQPHRLKGGNKWLTKPLLLIKKTIWG